MPIEVRRSTRKGHPRLSLCLSLSLSLSLPLVLASRSYFLSPSSFSFSLPLAPAAAAAAAAGQPTYVEMLRCKTVDCQGAVFSLCTAMVAMGVPGTTEGRRPRPLLIARYRDYVYYTSAHACAYVRVLTRVPRRAAVCCVRGRASLSRTRGVGMRNVQRTVLGVNGE